MRALLNFVCKNNLFFVLINLSISEVSQGLFLCLALFTGTNGKALF